MSRQGNRGENFKGTSVRWDFLVQITLRDYKNFFYELSIVKRKMNQLYWLLNVIEATPMQ